MSWINVTEIRGGLYWSGVRDISRWDNSEIEERLFDCGTLHVYLLTLFNNDFFSFYNYTRVYVCTKKPFIETVYGTKQFKSISIKYNREKHVNYH